MYKGKIFKACCCGVSLYFIIRVFFIQNHATKYYYVPDDEVLTELIQFENNSSKISSECPYAHFINESTFVSARAIKDKHTFAPPDPGGEFKPAECDPQFKSAIIVTYRDRSEHLRVFLGYMHSFLQRQRVHYRIYVVEQADRELFNKAKLYNIGALAAMRDGFQCLILHDVDLLPLSTGNLYACSKSPRHMSSSVDSFRYNLPYTGLFGGVVSVTSDQYKSINGMSNLYLGWGGEDDDLYERLVACDFVPYRFSPRLSRYTMLIHKKERPSSNRFEMLEHGFERQKVDGLNSLSPTLKYIINNTELYTHILV